MLNVIMNMPESDVTTMTQPTAEVARRVIMIPGQFTAVLIRSAATVAYLGRHPAMRRETHVKDSRQAPLSVATSHNHQYVNLIIDNRVPK